MIWSAAQFRKVTDPIIKSVAFSRLGQITFLGILSPNYEELPGFPIRFHKIASKSDQTRWHHSLSVAKLIAQICAELQLSKTATEYAIVWGLLHDIATWPLSHTGEASFSRSTDTDARNLRAMIVYGSKLIAPKLSLFPQVKAAGLDHETIVALFDKHSSGFDRDLAIVHTLIHSPVTPDTLEGMYRSGRVFGVSVPQPSKFFVAFERDMFSGVRIPNHRTNLIFDFWRRKSEIYKDYINASKTVEFESNWSRTIQDAFSKLSLNDSLDLSESEIIRKISGSRIVEAKEVQRYKDPLHYKLAEDYKFCKGSSQSIAIDDLSSVLIKR